MIMSMLEITNLLKPKVLTDVLGDVTTGGIKCNILISPYGTLLAHAGDGSVEAIAYSALATTVWKNYERCGYTVFHEDNLQCAIVQNSETTMLVQDISGLLLCMVSGKEVPIGMLKTKANLLARDLEEPLGKILKS